MALTIHPSRRTTEVAKREWEAIARRFDIDGLRLTVSGGPPVLEGFVPCYRSKKLAGDAVARLLGIPFAVNRLRVVPHNQRGDVGVAKAVHGALGSLPVGSDVRVSVHDGVVSLHGRVPSPDALCEAEAAVWRVGGVQDVDHDLEVSPAEPPARR